MQTHAVGSYGLDDRSPGLQSRVHPDPRVHVDGHASVLRGCIRTSWIRCGPWRVGRAGGEGGLEERLGTGALHGSQAAFEHEYCPTGARASRPRLCCFGSGHVPARPRVHSPSRSLCPAPPRRAPWTSLPSAQNSRHGNATSDARTLAIPPSTRSKSSQPSVRGPRCLHSPPDLGRAQRPSTSSTSLYPNQPHPRPSRSHPPRAQARLPDRSRVHLRPPCCQRRAPSRSTRLFRPRTPFRLSRRRRTDLRIMTLHLQIHQTNYRNVPPISTHSLLPPRQNHPPSQSPLPRVGVPPRTRFPLYNPL